LGQSTYEKEILAILNEVDIWGHYILEKRFQMKSNNRSRMYFLEQIISSLEKQKLVTKMFGYDYEIINMKGKKNMVIDSLSRKYEEEGSLFSLSLIVVD